MDNITNEEFQWLEEKYGKLLHHIAYRIGGDSITNDHEDSYQNLCFASLGVRNRGSLTPVPLFHE